MNIMKKSYIIFVLIFMFNEIICHLKAPVFKCQHFDNEEKNKLPTRTSKGDINQNEAHKRRVDAETDKNGYKDFNIYLDLENIKYEISNNPNLRGKEDFFINTMQKAVNTLQSLLKVKTLIRDFYLLDEDFRQLNISKWNTSLFGTEAYQNNIFFTKEGVDLAIFGTFSNLDESTLATASAKAYQPENGQPYIGLVKINKNVDYSKPHSIEYFESILLHEFTHILGFSKYFFETYYKNLIWEVDDKGLNRTYLNSEKVLSVAKKYFNCDDLKGVELENQGGSGTASSHWEARILLGEYMNGYSYTEEQVVSEFTLAVLEDSGYYKPNYYTGGLMRYGKNKGCEFLKKECVDKSTHKIKEDFENEFYDTITDGNNIDPSCSSGRQSRTYKAWYLADNLPTIYQYFENKKIVGYEPADFCPVSLKYQEEEDLSYYVGHCSTKGSGKYGSQINYIYSNINPLSEAVQKYTGENYSDHSFCFLSSLTKGSDYHHYFVRSNCYEIFCSERSLTVKIFDDYIVCPRAGGKVEVDGYEGFIACPDYNLMCSGTKVCNDIFECVEKKSEIKESSFNYDYNPKTTQNIPKLKQAEVETTDNYELSTDGVCPQYCSHCEGHDKCKKCGSGYGLTYGKNEELICMDVNILREGYFKTKSGIYIKCKDHCEVCEDTQTCSKCSQNYIYFNKTCVEAPTGFVPIENCLEYKGEGLNECERCEYKHGFMRTNTSKCYNIETELANYYTINGENYYPCSRKNPQCSKCKYNEEDGDVKCTDCIDDLVLKSVDNGGQCVIKSELENTTKYLMINENHYAKCSDIIEKCINCENETYCSLCEFKYEFNNITKKCHLKERYIKQEESESSDSAKNKTKVRGRTRKKDSTNDSHFNGYMSIKLILLLNMILIFIN